PGGLRPQETVDLADLREEVEALPRHFARRRRGRERGAASFPISVGIDRGPRGNREDRGLPRPEQAAYRLLRPAAGPLDMVRQADRHVDRDQAARRQAADQATPAALDPQDRGLGCRNVTGSCDPTGLAAIHAHDPAHSRILPPGGDVAIAQRLVCAAISTVRSVAMTEIRPRRSVLYMPGSNARALEKAREIAADALILDLEDAVAPEAK